MVPKLAQAIASGEVPDLMGMDLIYAPAVRSGRAARRHHRLGQGLTRAEDGEPGPHEVATYEGRLYGVPLYADVSALFWNKDLFEKAGLDPTSRRRASGKSTTMRTRSPPSAATEGLLPRRQLRRLQHLHLRPADLGLGRQDRAPRRQDEPLVGDNVPAVLEWAARMMKEGQPASGRPAENGRLSAKRFGAGKVGIMGTGNFNLTLVSEQNPDMKFGVSFLPGLEQGRRPRSPAAIS